MHSSARPVRVGSRRRNLIRLRLEHLPQHRVSPATRAAPGIPRHAEAVRLGLAVDWASRAPARTRRIVWCVPEADVARREDRPSVLGAEAEDREGRDVLDAERRGAGGHPDVDSARRLRGCRTRPGCQPDESNARAAASPRPPCPTSAPGSRAEATSRAASRGRARARGSA